MKIRLHKAGGLYAIMEARGNLARTFFSEIATGASAKRHRASRCKMRLAIDLPVQQSAVSAYTERWPMYMNCSSPSYHRADVRSGKRCGGVSGLSAVVRGVEIFRQDECHLEARVNIHFKGIRQHFTTRNTLQRPTRIEMVFLDGPFRKFTGYWHLTPLRENACKIEFALHYEFASRLLEVLIGPVFHHIADTFVEAFVRRARIKYKTPMC